MNASDLQQYYEQLRKTVADTSALDTAGAAADRAEAQASDAAGSAQFRDGIRDGLEPVGTALNASVASAQKLLQAVQNLRDHAQAVLDGATQTANLAKDFLQQADAVTSSSTKAVQAVANAVAADPLESAAMTQKDVQTAAAEAVKAGSSATAARQTAVTAVSASAQAVAEIDAALQKLKAALDALSGSSGVQPAFEKMLGDARAAATTADQQAAAAQKNADDADKKRDDLQAQHDASNAELGVVAKALQAGAQG